MTLVRLTVNGRPVEAAIEPRLHLADFLREHLTLTATHLGCEHGVCGACTLLIDGAPARSCITFAAACEGSEIRTLEGLEQDPVITALREAFAAEHGLQCGYCTPGMLVTARDILVRLPEADDRRVRLELAGNLCRCTGYAGIVRAIRRVRTACVASVPLPAEEAAETAIPFEGVEPVLSPAPEPVPGGPGQMLGQILTLALPRAAVWRALQDPVLLAGCFPGAALASVEGDRIRGSVTARLGPITGSFAGEARIAYDPEGWCCRIEGTGRDDATGTRLAGESELRLIEQDAGSCRAELRLTWRLQGPLAQFGRGPVVRALVNEIAAAGVATLEARLAGKTPKVAPPRLGLGGLIFKGVWRRIARLLSGRRSGPGDP